MITTRVMDVGRGIPALRVPVQLDMLVQGQGWREVGHGVTNAEGSIHDFGEPEVAGIYRLMFDIASYSPDVFFPSISIMFEVRIADERYHIPLMISPFSYSTHRES